MLMGPTADAVLRIFAGFRKKQYPPSAPKRSRRRSRFWSIPDGDRYLSTRECITITTKSDGCAWGEDQCHRTDAVYVYGIINSDVSAPFQFWHQSESTRPKSWWVCIASITSCGTSYSDFIRYRCALGNNRCCLINRFCKRKINLKTQISKKDIYFEIRRTLNTSSAIVAIGI